MGKKRSKGVTIFAWLMIILNIFLLVFSFDFGSYFACFKSFPNNFIKIIIIYSILSTIIGVIAGIGLLKLKNIMRKVTIAINSLDLLFGIPLIFLSYNDIKRYSYTIAVSELAKSPVKLNINSFANSIFYTVVFAFLIIFGLNLLYIYFFTRPKVKGQFN